MKAKNNRDSYPDWDIGDEFRVVGGDERKRIEANSKLLKKQILKYHVGKMQG